VTKLEEIKTRLDMIHLNSILILFLALFLYLTVVSQMTILLITIIAVLSFLLTMAIWIASILHLKKVVEK